MPPIAPAAPGTSQPTEQTPGPPRPSRRTAAVVLAVLSLSVLAGAWQDFTLFYLYHQADLGYVAQVGARIAAGEVPYRDFIFMWPPVTGLLMAGSFRIFGTNLWAAKLPLAVCVALAIPLAYRWLRACVSRRAALAGAALVWVFCPLLLRLPYAMYYALAPAFFVFWQMERLRLGRLLQPACLIGLAVGFTVGVKHNIGILLGLAVWVRLFSVRSWTPTLRGRAPATAFLDRALRIGGCLVALGALVHLQRQFTLPWITVALTLGPAALFTGIGTVQGLRSPDHQAGAIPFRSVIAVCLVIAAGTVAALAPWGIWLFRAGALDEFFRQSLIVRPAGQDWGSLYAHLLRIVPPAQSTYLLAGATAALAGALVTRARIWVVVATGICVALAVWAVLLERDVAGQRAFSYASVLLLLAAPALSWTRSAVGRRAFRMFTAAAWFLALGFPAATAGHMTAGLTPALTLGVALLWTITAHGQRVARLGVGAVVASLACLGWYGWAGAWRVPSATGAVCRAPVRIPGEHGGTWTRADIAAQLWEMRARLDQYAPPGSALVAWPALGLLNFYTARPNPTHMDLYWPGFLTPDLEHTVLTELEAAAPPIIVLNDAPDLVFGNGLLWTQHPKLAAYIHGHYVPVGALGTWTVHGRVSDTRVADVR